MASNHCADFMADITCDFSALTSRIYTNPPEKPQLALAEALRISFRHS